ncbi:hypothetical protein P691DRAFT_780029 [Macrolepiota fuliginosa MF-IS2]|uniref:Uncharacterized protein n=1 Tax=Macrolepiota fuliginosa MF-IS2 TaxID=1400762 RepID=A0A9P5WYG4_9AGAR|nr:hypothetical protein P691DRAFT_780029 [Macrolepiota fuliginosa MF-IS2]
MAPEVIQHHHLRWIQVLLESHSVETSDVDATRIRLPWPIDNEEERLDCQHEMLQWAVNYLMRALDIFVDDSIQKEFSRLATFFQDLDFGEMIGDNPYIPVMYLESVFAANLQRFGVLKTVPLQSFNFNDIRFDLEPVIIRHKERGTSLRLGWDTDGQEDPRALQWMTRYPSIVDGQGKISSDFEVARPSNNPGWEVGLEKNLATWTDMAPSHPVTILGRGRKSCAAFQFYVPGELWLLTLPCVQSL